MAANADMPQMSENDLRYLINHVFLPPRLPESNDTRPGCDDIFVGSLLSALQKFSELQAEAEEESAVLNCSVKMLKRLSESMRGSKILDKKESVKIAVEELSDGGMSSRDLVSFASDI